MRNLLVALENNDQIALVTLSQPEKRNAISMAMWRSLPKLMTELTENPAVKVIIVTGAGAHFAGGADISDFEKIYSDKKLREEYSELVEQGLTAVAEQAKPTIAMITGACVGAGCALATACDIRFADETARFGVPPAKLGLVYSIANTRRLAELVGRGRAADMLFTGRALDTQTAFNSGLVDFVEPKSTLTEQTYAYAQSICSLSQNSVQTSKRILNRVSRNYPDDDPASWQEFLDAFESDDFSEGYQAFLDKRRPAF